MNGKLLWGSEPRYYDWTLLLVRVALGITFLMHGYQKLFDMGVDNVASFFDSVGVPAAAFFAMIIALLELAGGAALILGAFTRIVSLLLAVNMLVALVLVHLPNGYFVSNGGIELVLLLGLISLGLVLSGAGAYSVDSLLLGKYEYEEEPDLDVEWVS